MKINLWTIMKYENKFYIAISLQAQKNLKI